jgi:hypothetical protein
LFCRAAVVLKSRTAAASWSSAASGNAADMAAARQIARADRGHQRPPLGTRLERTNANAERNANIAIPRSGGEGFGRGWAPELV